jgi:hypothetical protein
MPSLHSPTNTTSKVALTRDASSIVEETLFHETNTHDDNNQLVTLTESSSSSHHDDNHGVRCNSERGESIVQANWIAACVTAMRRM